MPRYLDFEVSLMGVKPRIWRRFLLASSWDFLDLHHAIQDACEWDDYHLWKFVDPESRATLAREPEEDRFGETEGPRADKVKLAPYFSRKGRKCVYVYDYGDEWHHLVVLKGRPELPERFMRRLLDGARAFPLEDCGGLWGYELCLKVVGALPVDDEDDPEEIEERREWVGDWDPEAFDLEATKKDFDA